MRKWWTIQVTVITWLVFIPHRHRMCSVYSFIDSLRKYFTERQTLRGRPVPGRFMRGCSGIMPVEGKRRREEWAEGGRGCHAVSAKASADPAGNSEASVALQCRLLLGHHRLCLAATRILAIPGEQVPVAEGAFSWSSAAAVWQLRLVGWPSSRQWGDSVLQARGASARPITTPTTLKPYNANKIARLSDFGELTDTH